MKTIEVFKTNVPDSIHGKKIIYILQQQFPAFRANFDLDDCDKILRLESGEPAIQPDRIIALMQQLGYFAEVLPD